MIRIYSILIFIFVFSFSCNHDKESELLVSGIDHIRWGSTNNPLNGVTISWRSKGTSDKIRWGYTNQFEKGVRPAETDSDYVGGSNKHEYVFESLFPSSIIYYRLYDSSDSSWTKFKTFKTARDPLNNHLKFTAGGDSRTNVNDWGIVSGAIEVCDFSLYLGDLTASGVLDQAWEDWYSYGYKFIPDNLIFFTRGGHDIGDNYDNNIVNPGNGRYYSFEFGNSVFIALDVPGVETWGEQVIFLEDVLIDNQDKTWKFVFFHAPFFTSQVHAGEMDTLRSTWWKIMDDYGVDFVLNGHEHSYCRSVPINLNISDTSRVEEYGSGPNQGRCQVIAGQYGAPAYAKNEGWFVARAFVRLHYTTFEVNNSELEFKAIDALTGEVFDSLSLRK
jgi:hypothetical protein